MSEAQRILFVEDEAPFRTFASRYLGKHGYEILQAGSASEALALCEGRAPDLVLLDLNLPDLHGVEVMRRMRALHPGLRVVVVTALGDASNAVKALKAGATDYLTKPIELEELLVGVQSALAAETHQAIPTSEVGPVEPSEPDLARTPRQPGRSSRRARSSESGAISELAIPGLSGEHPSWKACLERLRKVAGSGLSMLLLLGESGTGKSALARAFHQLGPRRDQPFVEVECPTIPGALLESELFGHERGAFTGATRRRRGQVELAEGGTLFLDEIGDLPLELQPKLLRFLEERRFRGIGGEREQRSDVNVVCATHHDLSAAVTSGAFRRDLFYRLDVVSIRLPPLRDRGDDVILIAEGLLETLASDMGREAPALSAEAREALRNHTFPGNVRELRNVLQRALAFDDGPEVTAEHFPFAEQLPVAAPATSDEELEEIELEPFLRLVEAFYLDHALRAGRGKSEAAAWLGVDRFAFSRRSGRRRRLGSPSEVVESLRNVPAWVAAVLGPLPTSFPSEGVDLTDLLEVLDRNLVRHAVNLAGSRTKAAALLGISRHSVSRRLS